MPEAAFCSYHPLMTKSECQPELLKWFKMCIFSLHYLRACLEKKILTMKYDSDSLEKQTTKYHGILTVKPGYMFSGSFPKLLSSAEGCGAELCALIARASRKARQPSSKGHMPASHISKVLKMCISSSFQRLHQLGN